MAQLLKPRMMNFKEVQTDQSKTSENLPQLGDFIKIQPVATGKNGDEFQPISMEKPESELENLWAAAKNNDNVYQSMVRAIKKRKRMLFTFLIFNFSIVIDR